MQASLPLIEPRMHGTVNYALKFGIGMGTEIGTILPKSSGNGWTNGVGHGHGDGRDGDGVGTGIKTEIGWEWGHIWLPCQTVTCTSATITRTTADSDGQTRRLRGVY